MASIGSEPPVVAAAIAALASHWLYFNKGEHHMRATLYFWLSITVTCATESTVLTVGSYALTIFASITVYRTCFHALLAFPGPRLAGASKFWHVYQTLDSQNPFFLEKLHQKYGSFVRTGPSEITIFLPEAIAAVDGPGSDCIKSAWYDNVLPMRPLVNIRDKPEHDMRRSIWNQAFTPRALRRYNDRVMRYGNQLEQHLAATSGHPIRANNWFYFFAFDVMGDLAFGKSFNMLTTEHWQHIVGVLREFLVLLGPFSPVPWFCRLGFGFPGAAPGWKRFCEYCKTSMDERIRTEVKEPDVSSHLIEHSLRNGTLEKDRHFLQGDALALIIAGSDSVGSTLTFLFHFLAKYPQYQDQIREELSDISDISDLQTIQALPGLRSIINETLRLFPVVPTQGVRITTSQGLTIAGRYIPPHTTVVTPRWNIARLENAFACATEFIPERWTSRPEMVRDKRAFAPFSQGRYSCVGQALALKEVSYVVARIVSRHNVEFAPGEDGTAVWKEMQDEFTVKPGKLDLVFRRRDLGLEKK